MTDEDPIGTLLRWEEFGGTWRVVSTVRGRVTISLCRCDGGEEVEQLVSNRPELLTWLEQRAGSTD